MFNLAVRPDFLPKTMVSATLQVPFIDRDGKQGFKQVRSVNSFLAYNEYFKPFRVLTAF